MTRVRLALFILVVFVAVWAGGKAVASAQSASVPQPFDLVILLDASGSLPGTDPGGLGVQAASFAIDYLQTVLDAHTDSRMVVVPFRSEVEPPLILQPLAEVNRAELSTLQLQGGTDFIAALDAAATSFEDDPRPDHRRVVLLITDGEPDVGEPSTRRSDIPHNLNYLQTEVGPVIERYTVDGEEADRFELFVIGVGTNRYEAFWSEYSYWPVRDSAGLLSVYEVLAPLTGLPAAERCPMIIDELELTLDEGQLFIFIPSGLSQTTGQTLSLANQDTGASEEIALGGGNLLYLIRLLEGNWQVVFPEGRGEALHGRVFLPPPAPTPIPTHTATSTPMPALTATSTPSPTATLTPTLGIVGPVVTATPTARPKGVVMPWSLLAVIALTTAGSVGGLVIMGLLLKDAKKKLMGKETYQSQALLQEAREALERGESGEARRLAERVIENATRLGEAVLDQMAADVGEALYIIRRATEDREQWVSIVLRYFKDSSVVVQRGLATALKVWWLEYPKEAIESIYVLLSKDGQDVLRFAGEHESSWLEPVPEIVKNNAKVVESICISLYNLRARQSDEALVSLLNEVARAFGAASGTFAHADDAQALYRCIAQLAAHTLWPVELPALSEESLPYFRNVARLIQQGFELHSPVWKGLPRLKQLEEEIKHAE